MEPLVQTTTNITNTNTPTVLPSGVNVPNATAVTATTAIPTAVSAAAAAPVAAQAVQASNHCANVVTIPVPIVPSEETYAYIMVKGSLYDRTSTVFGLNDTEIQALSKRFDTVKAVINGVMVPVPPVILLNALAQLSYKVICSCGEAEICWTMQREI